MEQPSWSRAIAGEARAGPELLAFSMAAGPLVAMAPRGDGHPVLVLPGLGGTDASTAPLRWFLGRVGYRAVGWALGRNEGFGRHVTDGLDELLAVKATAGPVSIIGWSLGGVHAIELARRRPDAVRSVITLGSPLGRRQPSPDAVPMTSIYSRSDAIVPWRMSIVPAGPRRESIEVRGSHLGLGHNPAVLVAVVDRLAQRPNAWRPFAAPRWARRWLPSS